MFAVRPSSFELSMSILFAFSLASCFAAVIHRPIPRVRAAQLSSLGFWDTYFVPRRPVIITDFASRNGFHNMNDLDAIKALFVNESAHYRSSINNYSSFHDIGTNVAPIPQIINAMQHGRQVGSSSQS